MIDPEFILSYRSEGRQKYDARDVMLYALGVGAGENPADLKYVYEKILEPLPTMAVVLAREPFWLNDPRAGINLTMILHGEQTLTVHKPLPVEGEVRSEFSVGGLYDKGVEKGAILEMNRELYDTLTGDHLASVGIRTMLRGNGGFGGKADGLPPPHVIPDRAPDVMHSLRTLPEQALIYRLSGDFNPIHLDQAVAEKARFPKPILHGLSTYGVAARAVIRTMLNDEPSRLRKLNVRFSRPVFPGDTIETQIWKESDKQAAFRCIAVERGDLVINNGFAQFA